MRLTCGMSVERPTKVGWVAAHSLHQTRYSLLLRVARMKTQRYKPML